LTPEEYPSISYYEYWGTGEDFLLHLRNVTWTGEYWTVRTVDTTPGSGKFNSLAIDSTGTPHIAYANVRTENASLRYARWNGTSWDVEVLEGADVLHLPVFSVLLVLDRHNTPHIAYTDVRNRLVKYATRVSGKWHLQVVDALAQGAYPDRNGLAVDDDGRPYISYYDAGSGRLKVAHMAGDKWVAEIVDQAFAGLNSSLHIHNNTLWLTYADETGNRLKSAHRPLIRPSPAIVSKTNQPR
jgi:hypothetical protein